MIFRLYHETRGGHVHCRLFAGQHEGALVRRKTPGAQQIVVVTELWLDALLRRQFQFVKNGQPVEHPAALARFVAARWREFPSVLKTGKTAE